MNSSPGEEGSARRPRGIATRRASRDGADLLVERAAAPVQVRGRSSSEGEGLASGHFNLPARGAAFASRRCARRGHGATTSSCSIRCSLPHVRDSRFDPRGGTVAASASPRGRRQPASSGVVREAPPASRVAPPSMTDVREAHVQPGTAVSGIVGGARW